jgi:fatty acid desaturase
MRRNNRRGHKNVVINAVTIILVIIGLSVHFTLNSLWNGGTVTVIVLLSFVAAFYVWLWLFYLRGSE